MSLKKKKNSFVFSFYNYGYKNITDNCDKHKNIITLATFLINKFKNNFTVKTYFFKNTQF